MRYKEADILYIAENAEQIITRILMPDGPVCPVCGEREYRVMKDGRYRCPHCHKIYNIKTGTIFSGTRIPMSKWLICLYLLLENKGVSSCAMSRFLGLSQTTCYFMMMKLRLLFTQEDVVLDGEIAIDEVYVGGTYSRFSLSKKNFLIDKYMLPKNPKTTREKLAIGNKVNCLYKQPIFGMNDGEKMILRAIPNPVTQDDLVDIYTKHAAKGAWTVSDCSRLYDNWELLTGHGISYNNHSKAQYVAEDGCSSNRVEGSFSQWKRQSLDKYCHISYRLIQLYLDEHCFRFNNRELTIIQKIELALSKCHQRVTRDNIRQYNSLDIFPIRKQKLLNPYEVFRTTAVCEFKVGDIVYRRADFVKNC